MEYRSSLDLWAINWEGKVIPSEELSFIGEYKINKSRWSFKEEPLPGADFSNFYNKFKADLPSGIDCKYKIIEHKIGPYCDSPSSIKAKIILIPSLAYLKERYLYYYSRDFENILKTQHPKELEVMFSKICSSTYIKPQGLYTRDSDGETGYLALSFSSLGLKPLNSLPQLYTLLKVLTDHLNETPGNNYYVRAYEYNDVYQKKTFEFYVATRPSIQQQTELKDW